MTSSPPRRPLRLLAALLATAFFALGAVTCAPKPEGPVLATPSLDALDRNLSFEKDVKPVLDGRCVVCHGCYDAPCQLLLSSREGAERGASKDVVYQSSRLRAADPTRLFLDAKSTEQWRKKGFFSVLGEAGDRTQAATDSLLLNMLALGHAHPFAAGERLPEEVKLDIGRELSCPTSDEFGEYARDNPLGGMPYGTAPLSRSELRTLSSFGAWGAAPTPAFVLPERATSQVASWETFLNGSSLEEKITARYLYEHWFLAHLYFRNLPEGPFFRIVRSTTPPGQPIDAIASERPYDDPGADPFWYRLQPIHSTIVHKTHIVYELSPGKMARLRELFLESGWRATRLPSYEREEASNPFVAFDQIPARSRYQYLLDDAQFFVMTFIRGPVCRGQVAVDVIEDHFFVAFLEPDRDLSVTQPEFLQETKTLLSLPAEHGGRLLPGDLFLDYAEKQNDYLDARERFYTAADPEKRGPALSWVWDGDGHDTNALLTVFSNFDNATVLRGFVGAVPKTAWIMDFPLLERIYYDLVAGFNVFGNVVHQVSTRLYMDHLRMQSENLFLMFLPPDRRDEIRASWYIDATKQLDYYFADSLRARDHGTQVRYSGDDVVSELIEGILQRAHAVAGPPDTLNRCAKEPCDRAGAGPTERRVERELRRIANVRGDFVALLPEVMLLRVRDGSAGGIDLVYALVHNDAYKNVASMFSEQDRRLPAEDTLTIVRGHYGSYPNFFLDVDAADVAAFAPELRSLRSEADLHDFAARRGVRRSDPRFWEISDWLNADLRRRRPTQAGLYDLGRYQNL